MLQLNNLETLLKKRKRVGRGGKRGGKSGRGAMGQKSRSGSNSELSATFEGGQMPLVRRIPRRGFNNKQFADVVEVINLRDLEAKFDNGSEVNKLTLHEKGVLKGAQKVRIKLLGKGALTKKLTVHVDLVSKSAAEAIEKAGGKVELTKE